MVVILDLDGTLYNSLPTIFGVDKIVRAKLGYPEISLETYRANFQSRSWKSLGVSLGIREEDIEKGIDLFREEYHKTEPPLLIEGAREALRIIEQSVGASNIYIVTQETKDRVELRFNRDGLSHLLPNVHSPNEGKTKELYHVATTNGDRNPVYIGDSVSDGEACKEAREMGAENLTFCGMLHEWAFSTRELMEDFIRANQCFAKSLNSLKDIESILI